jgi:adenylosuccinate synthase
VAKQIVLLTGRVSAGKTTLCNELEKRFDAKPVKTNELIRNRAGSIEAERGAMQRFGERLDRRTQGAWVCEDLTRIIEDLPEDKRDNAVIVVDSVRIVRQIEAIRKAYGPKVVHIHLEADVDELARRYELRKQKSPKYREFPSYSDLSTSRTEARVKLLARTADLVINTQRCTPNDVVVRAAAHLGLYGRESNRLVDVLVGGEYGSEGKGHICSHLAGEYDLLIRVGGPNAGHTVFEDPRPYKHYQLPCGTRSSNADLMIGPGAVLNVEKLLKEIADCGVTYDRLSIDPQAMVIEHRDKRREKRTIVGSIGSTGQGVGAATARKVMRGADGKVRLARDIRQLQPFLRESREVLERAFRHGKRIFLEGTQGTGLSLHHGHYPHVTSRETSVAGCLADAGISPSRVRKVIMVCRTYPIRVEDPANATSGPMSREISWAVVSKRSLIPLQELQEKERTTTTDRKRRVSEFDWDLFRRAVSLNAPTDIALTFVDYITVKNRAARRFEQLSEPTILFIEEIERVASAPVSLISTQFAARSIIDRRSW